MDTNLFVWRFRLLDGLQGQCMNFTALYIGLAIYVAYAIYLFVADDGVLSWDLDHNAENIAGTMKAQTPWIEDSREFFGLVILIIVLLINYLYYRKRNTGEVR